MVSLYTITHRVTGHVYIGKSVKPSERWCRHIKDAKYRNRTKLQKAIHEHGEHAFEWLVIECFATDAEAVAAERYWIERLREFSIPLYNQNDGGAGPPVGRKRGPMSLEQRKLLSDAKRGKKNPKLSERYRTIGPNPVSEATRLKLSAIQCGVPKSEEHRQKLAKHLDNVRPRRSGYRLTDEHKKAIAKALAARRDRLLEE